MEVNDTEKINLAVVRANKAYEVWDQQNGISSYTSVILYELLLRKKLTQKQLVNLSDFPKQSINKGIHNLEKAGRIKMVQDPNDKRVKYCSLTSEGELYAKKKMKSLFELEDKVAKKMGSENMKLLANLATKWSDSFWELLKERSER